MSDLHINWRSGNVLDLINTQGDPDVLIIPGDLSENTLGNLLSLSFFEKLCRAFREVVYVPGNHDFYLSGITRFLKDKDSAKLPRNLHFLYNDSFSIDKYKIVGTTLWYPFRPELPNRYFSDFVFIADLYAQVDFQHQEAVRFLKKELPENVDNSNVIVVTHHAPSIQSSSPQWADSDINHYFITPMEAFIAERSPKLWLHGHTHNTCDYSIMNTRVICNALGYVNEDVNFNNNLLIEI